MGAPLFRLLQGAGFSCAALGVGILFGLFLTPYMLSSIGEADYGVYALASLFSGWCGLLDFGLTTTTSRYVTRYYTKGDWKGVNEIGSTAITLFGGIASLVFGVACLAFGIVKFSGKSFDETGALAGALFFAGASFAISKISDGVCGILKGALRQELSGSVVLIFRILFGVCNFLILFWGGRVIALFIGNLILTTLQLCVYIMLTRRAVPLFHFSLRNFHKERVRTLVNYGFFTFLAQVGEIAVNRSDLIIIATLASMSDVARYNLVVVTLVSYFDSFIYETSSWETNWFARLASLERTTEDDKEEGIQANSSMQSEARPLSPQFFVSRDAITRAAIYISVFLAFEILTLGRPFLAHWIGVEYLSTFPALALCIVAKGFYRGTSETNTRLLQGLARHQICAIGSIVHGIANIVLSVLFVRAGLGLWGVALGTVLPGALIHYFWIPNATCAIIGERKSIYWSRQIKTTLIAISATLLPGWFALKFASPSYARILAIACFTALCYAITIYFAGLSSKERTIVSRFLKKRLEFVSNKFQS